MTFGERVNMVRNEKNMTFTTLASLCGTSEGVIRNYTKARRVPDIEMFVRLCKALDVTPDYLLQDNFVAEMEGDTFIETIKRLTPKQREFAKEFTALLLHYRML